MGFMAEHGDGPYGPVWYTSDCQTGERFAAFLNLNSSDTEVTGTQFCVRHEMVSRYLEYVPPIYCESSSNRSDPRCLKDARDPRDTALSRTFPSAVLAIGAFIFLVGSFYILKKTRRTPKKLWISIFH